MPATTESFGAQPPWAQAARWGVVSPHVLSEPLRDPQQNAALREPRRQDLLGWEAESDRIFIKDVRKLADILSYALEREYTVVTQRALAGYVVVSSRRGQIRLGGTCGFSRRAADLIVAELKRDSRAIWARSAGKRWKGWTEWGYL